jgi:hypothetical protein
VDGAPAQERRLLGVKDDENGSEAADGNISYGECGVPKADRLPLPAGVGTVKCLFSPAAAVARESGVAGTLVRSEVVVSGSSIDSPNLRLRDGVLPTPAPIEVFAAAIRSDETGSRGADRNGCSAICRRQ